MLKIGIVGTGSFGTTMAIVLAANVSKWETPPEIVMFVRRPEIFRKLSISRRHPEHDGLQDVELPDSIEFTESLAATLTGCTHLVFGVPSRFAESSLEDMKGLVDQKARVISLVKGFHFDARLCRLRMISSLIQDMLKIPADQICSLGGPNLYREIASNYSTGNRVHRACNATISSPDEGTAAEFRKLYFTEGVLRVYVGNDTIGAQICGALKNVIALMVGIGDGYREGQGMGRNFSASLITRASYEIGYFIRALGGRPETAYGLAGLGDMIATSLAGRSHAAGRKLAEGLSVEEVRRLMASDEIEAFHTLESVVRFLRELRIRNPNIALELPIIEAIYDVVYEGAAIDQAVDGVINRPPKREVRTDPYVKLAT